MGDGHGEQIIGGGWNTRRTCAFIFGSEAKYNIVLAFSPNYQVRLSMIPKCFRVLRPPGVQVRARRQPEL
jgi:hypothetical protein